MAGNELNNNNAGGVFKLEKHSGFSSTITSSFSVADMGGVTWHHTNANVIWGAGTVGVSNSVKQGTGFTSTVTSSFNGPSATDRTYGLDWGADGNLYIVINTTKVYRMTGFSSSISASFTIAGASMRGVAWDGTNALCGRVSKISKQSGFSSTVSSSITATNARDISWDGTNLLSTQVDAGGAKHRLHSGFSTTISSSWTNATPGSSLGIDWDGYPEIAVSATPQSIESDVILFN